MPLHLMFLLIRIQIHLMLLLSWIANANSIKNVPNSNTSYVIINRKSIKFACAPKSIQIHLMLLLIPLKINYLYFNNIKKILKYQASF